MAQVTHVTDNPGDRGPYVRETAHMMGYDGV